MEPGYGVEVSLTANPWECLDFKTGDAYFPPECEESSPLLGERSLPCVLYRFLFEMKHS